MAEISGIGWTDHTQHFWQGCNKVSAECTHCYIDGLMRLAGRVGHENLAVEQPCPNRLRRPSALLAAEFQEQIRSRMGGRHT